MHRRRATPPFVAARLGLRRLFSLAFFCLVFFFFSTLTTEGLAEEDDDTVRPYADHLIEIPSVPTLFQPLLSTIPMQLFAAGVARARGYDVDKPRNLAKSVTVE